MIVGVTGCIAAYKACELVRALQRSGCRVKVIMTPNATRFVGPTTFRALTGEPVAISLWEEPGARVHHTSLAQEADVFVVAPATANVIAKVAGGRADDLLTTAVLATEAPLIIAPAMNVHMWRAEATREHVDALRDRGVVIVEPATGELACGDVGEGRLADVVEIADAVMAEVRRSHDLAGVRLLVTAGPTREPIDPVRFISNAASGKTGYAIAEEAARRGAEVTLVSGPTVLPDPFGVKTVRVITALEMMRAAEDVYADVDAVIATAAVSDFRPESSAASKTKKNEASLTIRLEPNPDILANFATRKEERILIGFAAETDSLIDNARKKLHEKSLDLVVANDVSDPSVGFASDDNSVVLVSRDGLDEIPRCSKRSLARMVCDRLAALCSNNDREDAS